MSTRPSWLLAEDEHKASEERLSPSAWTVVCVNALRALGCSVAQSCSATAHFALETGRGKYYRAWNFGGVKATKAWAEARRAAGKRAGWWQDAGHVAQGDPEVCYYRAYDSLEDFLTGWLKGYVPRPAPGAVIPAKPRRSADYTPAGAAFWDAVPGDWFAQLLAAGYRGPVTKANPGPAITVQRQLEREVTARWAQARLGGLTVDGKWGARSEARCREYQAANGLPVTGLLDVATLAALAAA